LFESRHGPGQRWKVTILEWMSTMKEIGETPLTVCRRGRTLVEAPSWLVLRRIRWTSRHGMMTFCLKVSYSLPSLLSPLPPSLCFCFCFCSCSSCFFSCSCSCSSFFLFFSFFFFRFFFSSRFWFRVHLFIPDNFLSHSPLLATLFALDNGLTDTLMSCCRFKASEEEEDNLEEERVSVDLYFPEAGPGEAEYP